MPPSLEFLRGVLGLIGIGCAFMLGRTTGLVRKGEVKSKRLYAWIFRAVLCLGAISIRHEIDAADIGVWTLAVVAYAVGFWDTSRQKKDQEVKLEIYPDDR